MGTFSLQLTAVLQKNTQIHTGTTLTNLDHAVSYLYKIIIHHLPETEWDLG
jgi:hypothetical protein